MTCPLVHMLQTMEAHLKFAALNQAVGGIWQDQAADGEDDSRHARASKRDAPAIIKMLRADIYGLCNHNTQAKHYLQYIASGFSNAWGMCADWGTAGFPRCSHHQAGIVSLGHAASAQKGGESQDTTLEMSTLIDLPEGGPLLSMCVELAIEMLKTKARHT